MHVHYYSSINIIWHYMHMVFLYVAVALVDHMTFSKKQNKN